MPAKNRAKFTIEEFTDLAIKALQAKEERYDVWEECNPGFGVRISIKGAKSWAYLYSFQSRTRRMTLGRYPEMSLAKAREEYFKVRGQKAEKIDPLTIRVEDVNQHAKMTHHRRPKLTHPKGLV